MSDPQLKTKTPLSELNLFSRSVKADQDDWLVFTIQETLPAQVEYEKLRTWLENNRPSKVTRESGVGWISVRLGSVTNKELKLGSCQFNSGVERGGLSLPRPRRSGRVLRERGPWRP